MFDHIPTIQIYGAFLCQIAMLLPLLVLLIWPVVKGWRLRAEANPHRIKPDALRLMRALRWYLYEPPLTSVYIVIILLLDVVPSGGRGIGEFVPEHVFLMVPMLILLVPLGSLRSTDTMVRSYAAKALGLGLLRISLVLATYLFVFPFILWVAVLVYSISCCINWHNHLVDHVNYPAISVGKEGVLVTQHSTLGARVTVNLPKE